MKPLSAPEQIPRPCKHLTIGPVAEPEPPSPPASSGSGPSMKFADELKNPVVLHFRGNRWGKG